MKHIEWKRTELNPGDPGSGSAAAQLFEGKKQMRLEIFVREDLQNRVDARRADQKGPVHVRIVRQSLPMKLVDRYFPPQFQAWFVESELVGLKAAEAERRRKAINAVFGRREMEVLVIEDFGGTGLNGPVNSRIVAPDGDDPLHHDTNALTCFFRLNGQSGKTQKMLGAAGLGRHVYYKASEISSKLIYTVPTDMSEKSGSRLVALEPRALFFGQSFQKELARREGDAEHRYCSYLHLSGKPRDGLPMPFGIVETESETVEQMRRDFQLKRNPKEPGCSLVIPFPKKNFTEDGLVKAIVREFSMPILTGRLTVEVGEVRIGADNLAEISDDARVNLHNAFLARALKAQPVIRIDVAMKRLAKPFAEDLFEDGDVDRLAGAYHDGVLACVDARLQFGPRAEQVGIIRIAAESVPDGCKGRNLVSRSDLVLSDYSDATFSRRNNALVRVSEDELGSLLRGIENPAHTEWLAGDAEEHACPCAEDLIRFIRYAHVELVRMLVNRDTDDDVTIFSDLVPKGGRREPPEPTEHRDPPFEVMMDVKADVMTIEVADVYDAAPGTIWSFSLVYDSIQGLGRARKAFRPGTFDLSRAPISILGGEVMARDACTIDVSITSADSFRMAIGPCGFDGWADIRFRADMLRGSVEAEA